MIIRRILLLMGLLWSLQTQAQSEFDSLKRNSMFDSSYQPSAKPTVVTDFVELKIQGFVQSVLYFDYNSVFDNDLFITSAIPTETKGTARFSRTHFSANQSRIAFNLKYPHTKKPLTAFIEGDFFANGDERPNFRLRHAYVNWGDWLFGQTWTNFGDVASAPNTIDLEGPNSMPASRVAQVRWTKNINRRWQLILAAEEPKPDYTPLPGAKVVNPGLPEFVLKPKYKINNGYLVASLIYKKIKYTDSAYSFSKSLYGWGLATSFYQKFEKKGTLNLFATIGKGTQGAINDFSGLGLEALPVNDSTLERVMYYGGYLAGSVIWDRRWSSTVVYSYLGLRQPTEVATAFKLSHYVSLNGIYAINKYFTTGLEGLYGIRRNHDLSRGSAFRVMWMVRLVF
ncbi:DcaP family trimeric outer membrane transporter [Chitinophaga skermanii]|nr:DcaP family trimeric outer membrane transporter [Chitinophaga skermanii]